MNDLHIFIGSTIKQLRKQKGYTQTDLANILGVSKQTVSKYENGTIKANQDTLFSLADIFGVSINDFFPPTKMKVSIGKSTPIPSTDLPSTIAKLNQELNSDNHSKWIDYGSALLEEQESTVEELGITYDVETVSSLAAGLGFSYDDNDTNTVQVTNEPPRHDIASIVDGDSMLPNYHDGDVVYLVDKGISNYSGQVCAVVVNDKTYLKRVYTEPNALRLVSINPKYSDIVIDFPPSEDTHIKIFSVIGSDRTI